MHIANVELTGQHVVYVFRKSEKLVLLHFPLAGMLTQLLGREKVHKNLTDMSLDPRQFCQCNE